MTATGLRFDTAEMRWAGIGPYYAMFPTRFADEVIRQYTEPGDLVLDPFAGRSTAVYSAATQGRVGVGIELNPVGWVYGKAKLSPGPQRAVEQRLAELATAASGYASTATEMPEFFHYCFSRDVRRFLLAARSMLDWRRRATDWTLMALLLVYLHGKRHDSLSNQMRQTKAMSPEYAIRWWRDRGLTPPEVNPVEFMQKRIKWRYSKGRPKTTKSRVYLGECTELLTRLRGGVLKERSVRLLLTSPPYFGVTNYHYDQWIRLWLLGFSPEPNSRMGRHRERFQDPSRYVSLLNTAFRKAASLLADDGIAYVRTDTREFTYCTTLEILGDVFPGKRLTVLDRPLSRSTQTHLFGVVSNSKGEVDLVLEPA